jgi:hypothetical protein
METTSRLTRTLPSFDLIPDGLEAICLEIKRTKSKPFFVISWYRPPKSPA